MSGSGFERPASYSGLHSRIVPHDEREMSATSAQPLSFHAYSSEVRPSSPILTPIKQPARSFFHSSNYRAVNPSGRSFYTLLPPNYNKKNGNRLRDNLTVVHTDSVNQPPHVIRDQTAELAFYALSEAANSYQAKVPLPLQGTSILEECAFPMLPASHPKPITPSFLHETEPTIEEPEPPTPPVLGPGQTMSRASHLTHLLKDSPPQLYPDDGGVGNHHNNINWQTLSERTSLLCKGQQPICPRGGYNAIDDCHRDQSSDIESQNGNDHLIPKFTIHKALAWPTTAKTKYLANKLFPQESGKKGLWNNVVLKPVLYIPAVILGLLLNVLDGLSYGE